MSQVQDLKKKVNGLLFLCQFEQRTQCSLAALETLRAAAERIRGSAGLKEVMKSVLAIGNAMNNSGESATVAQHTRSSGAPIKAFKLNSLLKLAQTKSTDGTATVMDYLLQLLSERTAKDGEGDGEALSGGAGRIGEAKAALALSIDVDLECVHACCKLSLSELRSEARALRCDVNTLQNLFSSMKEKAGGVSSELLSEFESKLAAVGRLLTENDALLELCMARCTELCIYFSEDSSAPATVFAVLSAFIKNFSAIKAKLVAKNKKLMAQKRAKEKEREKGKGKGELPIPV